MNFETRHFLLPGDNLRFSLTLAEKSEEKKTCRHTHRDTGRDWGLVEEASGHTLGWADWEDTLFLQEAAAGAGAGGREEGGWGHPGGRGRAGEGKNRRREGGPQEGHETLETKKKKQNTLFDGRIGKRRR